MIGKHDLPRLAKIAKAVQGGETYTPGCTGKKGYPSKRKARGTKAEVESGRWRVYLCSSCKSYHRTKAGTPRGRSLL